MVTLNMVKLALRKTENDFDTEIEEYISAAKADLGIAGVVIPEKDEAIVNTAIITYVKMHFGQPDEYERLKKSYDEQKAQLSTATGFTTWTDLPQST